MKTNRIRSFLRAVLMCALGIFAGATIASCSKSEPAAHSDHDGHDHSHGDGHDHDHESGHSEDDGHDHSKH